MNYNEFRSRIEEQSPCPSSYFVRLLKKYPETIEVLLSRIETKRFAEGSPHLAYLKDWIAGSPPSKSEIPAKYQVQVTAERMQQVNKSTLGKMRSQILGIVRENILNGYPSVFTEEMAIEWVMETSVYTLKEEQS